MARPNQSADRRAALLPKVAEAFAERGYRRLSTASLAEHCEVQENILYRLWPDKRAMFVAAINHVYLLSEQTWQRQLARQRSAGSAAELLLRYEARHLGEHGLYRIVFSALGETDDPAIRTALRGMYRRFHAFVEQLVEAHHGSGGRQRTSAATIAWGLLALGTVANIGREVGLLSGAGRRRVMEDLGQTLLGH